MGKMPSLMLKLSLKDPNDLVSVTKLFVKNTGNLLNLNEFISLVWMISFSILMFFYSKFRLHSFPDCYLVTTKTQDHGSHCMFEQVRSVKMMLYKRFEMNYWNNCKIFWNPHKMHILRMNMWFRVQRSSVCTVLCVELLESSRILWFFPLLFKINKMYIISRILGSMTTKYRRYCNWWHQKSSRQHHPAFDLCRLVCVCWLLVHR